MDMYSRTGKIDISVNIFDSMVTGYILPGRHSDALVLLHEMQMVENNKTGRKNHNDENENRGFYKPNSITLMKRSNRSTRGKMITFYACVVDLLGRTSRPEEAYELVNTMPAELDKVFAWSSLLGACRIHQNLELGEVAAKNLLHLEPNVASHYVLISNIYSSAGLWNKATEVRKIMRQMGVKKEPGT